MVQIGSMQACIKRHGSLIEDNSQPNNTEDVLQRHEGRLLMKMFRHRCMYLRYRDLLLDQLHGRVSFEAVYVPEEA